MSVGRHNTLEEEEEEESLFKEEEECFFRHACNALLAHALAHKP